MRCPHCQRKIGGASWNADPAVRLSPADRNPPEGGALEGELAEALRAVVVGNACMRFRCDEGCRCSLGHARRTLARYNASKAIPQSGTVKEGTGGK